MASGKEKGHQQAMPMDTLGDYAGGYAGGYSSEYMPTHTRETLLSGSMRVDRRLLGEALCRFLNRVSTQGAFEGSQNSHDLSDPLLSAASRLSAAAVMQQNVASLLRKVVNRVGDGLHDLLDAIAYDLNLHNPDAPSLSEETGIGETRYHCSHGGSGFLLETDLQRKEAAESRKRGLRDVGGMNVLTQLRKVRESIRRSEQDLDHLQHLALRGMGSSQQEMLQDNLFSSLSVIDEGKKLEAQLELGILDDQIQSVLKRQKDIDPASHDYLKGLLEIENLELQKIKIQEIYRRENQRLLTEEVRMIRNALEALSQNGAGAVDEEVRQRLLVRLQPLEEEKELLGS